MSAGTDGGSAVQILINPIAGGGRSLGVWRRIAPLAAESLPGLRAMQTEGPGHATLLARDAVASGCRRLIVVGGDGTIQEVVAGILGTDTAVGVVPGGTGNDFSRTHRIPRDPEAALRLALAGPIKRIDVGKVNGHVFVNVAGVGFDAEVAAWCKHRTRMVSGPAIYVAGIFRHLFTYSPQELTFTLDSRSFQERCLLLAVGNGRYYGGGMMMCPGAEADDGQFDVCVGGNLGKLETLRLLPLVFSGRHVGRPKVITYRAKHVTVASRVPMAIHADGEPVGMLPAEFQIVRNALSVAAPLEAAESQPGEAPADRGRARAAG
ncbi:MAG: diacylglycerol kinase family lipid kinase [Bacillota bacterium]|nr:diacylglycerol kinase family lipid kinase [Bacillota bacterium]